MVAPAQEHAKPFIAGLRLPSERTVRIATGSIIFAYAASHFLSHATGLGGLETMEKVGRGIILAPWRTYAGQTILFGSLFTHATLGFKALIRRRHLRMPAIEAVQLVLGLMIPLLLIPHAANVRLGSALFGLDDSYYRLVYQYWITTAVIGLPRQFLLMLAIWIHGCIGLHMYLRMRGWYRARLAWFAGLAILVPFLAILGIDNAGWSTTLRATTVPGFSARNGPPPAGSADARNRAELEALWDWLCVGYLGLVVGVFGYRGLRRLRDYRGKKVRIAYPERPPVTVPLGHTVLEASRWAGIPHTSICGGRARCSTCRVRITHGEEGLPPPSAIERATLDRVKAPAHVRLACQLRPPHDIGVVPLIPAGAKSRGMRIAVEGGAEVMATALCVDLRDSTALAAGKLPYDSLFIVDRYVQCASGAITANGGYVTSVAGDGIMSVFGVRRRRPTRRARRARGSVRHLGRARAVERRAGARSRRTDSVRHRRAQRQVGPRLDRAVRHAVAAVPRRHRQRRGAPAGAEQGARRDGRHLVRCIRHGGIGSGTGPRPDGCDRAGARRGSVAGGGDRADRRVGGIARGRADPHVAIGRKTEIKRGPGWGHAWVSLTVLQSCSPAILHSCSQVRSRLSRRAPRRSSKRARRAGSHARRGRAGAGFW